MSKIMEKQHFDLICLHGNSEHATRYLSIVLVTMAYCLCDCKAHKVRNFNFSENMRPKIPLIDLDPFGGISSDILYDYR